jgi:hypothetical protein
VPLAEERRRFGGSLDGGEKYGRREYEPMANVSMGPLLIQVGLEGVSEG